MDSTQKNRAFSPQILRALLAHSNIPGKRHNRYMAGVSLKKHLLRKRNKEAPKVFHNLLLYIYDHNPCWCVKLKVSLSQMMTCMKVFQNNSCSRFCCSIGFTWDFGYFWIQKTPSPSQQLLKHHAKLVFGVTDSLLMRLVKVAWAETKAFYPRTNFDIIY